MRSDTLSSSAALSLTEIIREIVRETVAEELAASVPTSPQSTAADELLTLGQVAKVLGVSRSQVDKLIRHHQLPFTLVGSQRKVPRGVLGKWAESRLQTVAA